MDGNIHTKVYRGARQHHPNDVSREPSKNENGEERPIRDYTHDKGPKEEDFPEEEWDPESNDYHVTVPLETVGAEEWDTNE